MVKIRTSEASLVKRPIVKNIPATSSAIFPIYTINEGEEKPLNASQSKYGFIFSASKTSQPWKIMNAPTMILIKASPESGHNGEGENIFFIAILFAGVARFETVPPLSIYTTGHLNVDCSFILFPVAPDSLVASITSNTCNACSTAIRGSFPEINDSEITDAPSCHT